MNDKITPEGLREKADSIEAIGNPNYGSEIELLRAHAAALEELAKRDKRPRWYTQDLESTLSQLAVILGSEPENADALVRKAKERVEELARLRAPVEVAGIVKTLRGLHASRVHVPGIGGQQLGLEEYRIKAMGCTLESLEEAAAALESLAAQLADAELIIASRDKQIAECERVRREAKRTEAQLAEREAELAEARRINEIGTLSINSQLNDAREESEMMRRLIEEALIHFNSYPIGADQQGIALLRRIVDAYPKE